MAFPSTMTSRFILAPEAMPPAAIVFGRSDVMRAVRSTLQKGASANVPVLLHGESGTGKDVLARFIHDISPWRTGPFVKVNCPKLRGETQEHEIFGNDASSGPQAAPPRVQLAAGGTLFFDEIADLNASSQTRLLEFLQEGHFCERNGGVEGEARVICAVSRSLEDEVAHGRFRQDLFYRLNVIHVRVPSLRERKADVPVLVDHFYRIFSERYRSVAEPLSEKLVEVLCGYSWPGNIRELENVIKRYVILATEEAILAELGSRAANANARNVPKFVAPEIGPDQPVAFKQITRAAVRDVERELILKTLQANGWNRRRAARALSISYRALMYKMKDVEIGSATPNGNGIRLHER
jgi:two-component system, NtrC family, response regulator AtoC